MPLGLCWHLLYSEIWKWLGWAMKHTPCAKFLCVVTRKPRWWKGKTEAHGFWRWSHSCGFTSAEISKVKSSKLNDSNNGECLLLVWAEYFRCFVLLNSHNPLSPGSFLLFPLYKWRDWGLESFNNLPNIPQLVSGEHGMQTVFGSRALVTTL